MDIWNGLEQVPDDLTGSVVTIGVFDGVHRGHQQLIASAVQRARQLGVPAVMVTFDPHPTVFFRPDAVPPALASLEQRSVSAAKYGIDAMLVINFDRELAGWSPRTYFDRVIRGVLHARAVVIGENFTFGHLAAGTAETMRELGEEAGVDVVVHGLLQDPGDPDRTGAAAQEHVICSTWIRQRLAEGDVAAAGHALGRNFTVRGVVTRGAGRGGAALGFPTANLYFPDTQALPADGVYAGDLRILPTRKDPAGALVGDMAVDVHLPAAISVGTNPTFGDETRSVEAYVLDHEADLYGRKVTVSFTDRIRGMETYDNLDSLIAAIDRDVSETRRLVPREPE
ncbi:MULTISPECIES: bifunctional riboflavin kinase/FAD synthetase [Corynebacterium]|uniref:Riboflavin biosynthesis protein n=1 Tax=Corynebacterium provencense TaxID=1737425 RepID=A0A2Z3YTS4_9CORY|nr:MULTISPECIES: bifunctional riboflavin kinase/FAD synthetase [Corynebacterium]AWT26014.1 Riboflavin biosynthesis protein RibF [Corynebacterium provencense]MCI1256013.1 bifunctional riboflavin kinase/FAD synthetase [Corynebacterium provencense]